MDNSTISKRSSVREDPMEEDLWKDDESDGKTTSGGTASLVLNISGLRVLTGNRNIWRRTAEEIRARCGLSRS
jgi:hypothetical protein